MNSPILQTKNLIIRALDINDTDAMFHYRSDKDIARYQSWHPTSLKEVRCFIQKYSYNQPFFTKNSWFQLGLYLQPRDELIGDIGLHFLNNEPSIIEIGYTISPFQQRKGFAFEAITKIREFLFDKLKTRTILAVVDQQNMPSISLLIKLGFKKWKTEQFPKYIEKQSDDVLFTYSKDNFDSNEPKKKNNLVKR